MVSQQTDGSRIFLFKPRKQTDMELVRNETGIVAFHMYQMKEVYINIIGKSLNACVITVSKIVQKKCFQKRNI